MVALAPRRTWAQTAEALPKTRAVLRGGMERGLHIGAQIFVSRDGRTVADFGLGEARSGVPMTALHLYGKAEARPGRKMGHLTSLADTPGEALERVLRARELLSAG